MDILFIIQLIQAGLAVAPQIGEAAIKAKNFISALFGAGLITAEQQGAIHAHVDKIVVALKAGEVPPHWQVEADPA